MAQPSNQPLSPSHRIPSQGCIQPMSLLTWEYSLHVQLWPTPPSKTRQTFLCHPVSLASTSPTLPLGTSWGDWAGPGCDGGGTSALPGGQRACSAVTEALHLPGWSEKPIMFSLTRPSHPSASNDPSRTCLKGRGAAFPPLHPITPHSLPGLRNSQNRVCSSYLFGLLAAGHVEMLQSGVGRCPQPRFLFDIQEGSQWCSHVTGEGMGVRSVWFSWSRQAW